jgi:ABC-type multidrug transport system permease subunit
VTPTEKTRAALAGIVVALGMIAAGIDPTPSVILGFWVFCYVAGTYRRRRRQDQQPPA